jgi:hypothetical protein
MALGKFIAKMIIDEYFIPMSISRAFAKLILNKPLTFEDFG